MYVCGVGVQGPGGFAIEDSGLRLKVWDTGLSTIRRRGHGLDIRVEGLELRLKDWDSGLSTIRRRGHGLDVRGGGLVGSCSQFRTWRSRVEA